MITTLIATVALSIDMTPLERAIWKVETNCRTGEIWGDNHTSAGGFQIGKPYFTDSKIKGKWPDAVFDLDTSVLCFRAYMETKAEAMARMHNGGPAALRATGKKKENLDRYWSKVQKALKELTR